ncbi:hypothetical protein OEZ85_005046 [Tetradesmus obliquus]|uniref:Uncharacterized protein n=1 Tax=Tetradesmus obliquus TaxID=3088 RepID=A0ABY8UKD0_TETOB|nr:hypothetical protein OEZ85_005046 [Tetradesmus obliquus]
MAATVAVNEDEAVQLLASGRHIPMQLDNTAAGQLQQRIAECLQAAKGAIAAAQQKCTAGQAVYIKLAGAKTATGICTARYQKPGTGVHDHRPRTRPRKAVTQPAAAAAAAADAADTAPTAAPLLHSGERLRQARQQLAAQQQQLAAARAQHNQTKQQLAEAQQRLLKGISMP